jgi:pyruvate/2-oxoglutarate dehydrogenase complex dihydrolipoamide acyltransferase (E2) component
MLVPITDFHTEVTGKRSSIPKVRKDLARWHVPLEVSGTGAGARIYHKADLSFMEAAKAAFANEQAAKQAANSGAPRAAGLCVRLDLIEGKIDSIIALLQRRGK